MSALWQHTAALILIASVLTWALSLTGVVKTQKGTTITVLCVILLGPIPLGGISASGLVLSFSPSLSVAGTAMWGLLLIRRLGVAGLSRAIASSSVIVMAVSVALSVSVILGFGMDIYNTAYGFGGWDIILGLGCFWAFISRRPLAYVLAVCLIAHAVGLMESSNLFDTLVDGPSFLGSIVVTAGLMAGRRGLSLPKPRGL